MVDVSEAWTQHSMRPCLTHCLLHQLISAAVKCSSCWLHMYSRKGMHNRTSVRGAYVSCIQMRPLQM